MRKNFLVAILCLGLVVVAYFIVERPSSSPAYATIGSIPTISLESKICDRVIELAGDCQRILLYDTRSHLVFAESSIGIYPVFTNNEFTDIKKLLNVMDFQEFSEEKVERGPIDWRAANNVQKDFSVIYGFAEDDAKTIVINSEGNIQPNKFFVRENLWVWYATVQKDKVKLPVEVTVYDSDGQVIYGGNNLE